MEQIENGRSSLADAGIAWASFDSQLSTLVLPSDPQLTQPEEYQKERSDIIAKSQKSNRESERLQLQFQLKVCIHAFLRGCKQALGK